MKTMILTGIRKMEPVNVDIPRITKDTDVLIKMKTVGVCGSDIHYYVNGRIGSQVVKYPFPVGHEGAGVVVETGKKVTNVKPGDRIAIEPAMPCFECDQCRSGRHNTCRKLKFLGCPGQADGCLSEYIVMPETSCLKIADNVSFEEAAISEPLSIGLYAVKQAGEITGKVIGILGYGPIGMSVHLSSLIQNPGKIIVTDKISGRLNIAEKTGIFMTADAKNEDVEKNILRKVPEGLDIVFECCGKQEALNNSINLLKPGGKIILVGIPEFDHWSLPADLIRRKELTIINIRRQNHCAEYALELLEKKKIDVSKMPTHWFSFSETKEAFDLVDGYHDGVMKAIINMD